MAQDDDEFAEGRRALSPVVISAIGATFLVFIFSRTFQLAFIAIMSRLLSPAEFGIAAAATLFISFVQFSALFGVGVALVQAKSVDRNMLRAANTFSVGSALFFTLLSIAAAPLAGLWFHDVRVVAPARLIALAVLAQGFMLAPQAVMSRQLRSRDVTLIELFSNVIGSAVVSIPLAVLGWGYWSLAIGTVVQALTKAILLACIVRTPQAPLFDFVAIRALCARGSGHYFLMIVGRISAEIDRAVVGRYLGPADLGFYSRASAAASFPGSIYSVVVDRVTLPAFAKVQAQRERLVAAYRSGLSLVAMLGLPLTVCLIVLGPDLIRVLLGPGWEQAVLVFEFVSVSIYFRLAVLVSGTLLRSVGRPYLMTAIQLVVLIATGAAALVAWPHGIIAVAGAVVVVSLGEWLATTIAACREARFSLVAYLQTQGHGLAGSILCAVVLIAVLQLDGILGLKAPLRLALAGGSLALVGVAAIAAAPRFFLGATGQDALRLLLDGIRRGGRA